MESGLERNERDAAKDSGPAVRHRDRGLVTIGMFKLIEAVFLLLVGFGVIHFIHHDLGDAAVRLAERLRMRMDGLVMTWVLNHVDDLTAQRMKRLGIFTFLYAGVRVAEGVGLVLEKAWAEYMTVGVTVSFLPWEVYEIWRHPDILRVGLLITNLIILAYLLWVLRRNRIRAGAEIGC